MDNLNKDNNIIHVSSLDDLKKVLTPEQVRKIEYENYYMSFIFKNKNYILVSIIILSLFYWFQYRPVSIRKECSEEVFSTNGNYYGGFANEYLKGEYNLCLAKKGIKN